MSYDQKLADRVRKALPDVKSVTERQMFGGIAWMVRGNMCLGVVGSELMVRVGPQEHESALAQPHTRVMDFTGRPMRGYVYVAPEGTKSGPSLLWWVRRGLNFVAMLPPKKKKEASASRPSAR